MSSPRIKFPSGDVIELAKSNGRWVWQSVSEKTDMSEGLVNDANMRSFGYKYSPSDGYPGIKLAVQVAVALGGTPVLPKVPEVNPDLVY